MFKIFPLCDETLQEKYLSICNVKRRPNAFIYAMCDIESEEVMAISQFEIFKDHGYIYDIKARESLDDFEAMFILGRQTMNFIDLCGAHSVQASAETTDDTLLRAIGFKKQDSGEYFCDMDGMFDGKHCSGHAVDLDALK